MMELHRYAGQLLKRMLNNPAATFRDGQWEAIADLVERKARLLVVQRTGCCGKLAAARSFRWRWRWCSRDERGAL
jgi:superfamily II DNA helicase RecQ